MEIIYTKGEENNGRMTEAIKIETPENMEEAKNIYTLKDGNWKMSATGNMLYLEYTKNLSDINYSTYAQELFDLITYNDLVTLYQKGDGYDETKYQVYNHAIIVKTLDQHVLFGSVKLVNNATSETFTVLLDAPLTDGESIYVIHAMGVVAKDNSKTVGKASLGTVTFN